MPRCSQTLVCTFRAFRPTQVMKFLLRLNYLVYILTHKKKTGHLISFEDFAILSTGFSHFEVLLRESLLISKLNPSFSANINSFPLALFWCHLLTLTPLSLSHFYILWLPRLFKPWFYVNPYHSGVVTKR